MNKRNVYMARLARLSKAELVGLRDYVARNRAAFKYAALMLDCIGAALLAKVGLPTA